MNFQRFELFSGSPGRCEVGFAIEQTSARIIELCKGGATGWTGVDMSTPLSSGRYSFLRKNDIKNVRYTFWQSILSFVHPTFLGLAPPLGLWDLVSRSIFYLKLHSVYSIHSNSHENLEVAQGILPVLRSAHIAFPHYVFKVFLINIWLFFVD